MIRFGSDKNDNRNAMEDFNGNTGAFPSHHLVEHTAVMENYPGLSVWLGLL